METKHTYCRICEPGCALIAETYGDTVTLRPDKEHPVHRGFICHKGLNFTEMHFDPDRLDFPMRRTNAKSPTSRAEFERIGWSDAIDEIAARLQSVREKWGDDVIGMYVGNPSAFNSTARDAARQFARAVGVSYSFGSGTQDCSNKFAGAEAMFGTANLHPIPDFTHTEYLLSVGANPRISHMSFVHTTDPMGALRDMVRRGGKVRHINPRRIESATPATGEVTLIKPDTDLYFLAALIESIQRSGCIDEDYISAHGVNSQGLFDFVARYPAERVTDVVGISAEMIHQIAAEFAGAASASVHMSTGANMGRQGTLAYWLLNMLSLTTGNLGRRGGNLYSPGYFPAATVGKPRTDDPFFDTEFGELRTILGNLPANLMPEYIESGALKALVVMSGNPLLSVGGEARLRETFAALELLVVIDIYPSATAEFTDYALPATDWLERADINAVALGYQPQPYVQVTDAVVEPRFERKAEWWIFSRLLQALHQPSPLDDPNFDPMARHDRQLGGADLSLEKIEAAPSRTVRLQDPDPAWLFEIAVQKDDGKVDCCPTLFTRAFDTAETQFCELLAEPADQLKLISLRTNYMVNSWFHNLPSLKREQALDNPLHIHPRDAERHGLTEGAEVSVESSAGRLVATIKRDDSLRDGVVAMTHGWGHAASPELSLAHNYPGVNVNALLPHGPDSYEKLSNMSHMTGIAVTLTAI